MPDFLFLMHTDARQAESDAAWEAYVERLVASGGFSGGSAIGAGVSCRSDRSPAPVAQRYGGFLRITAPDIAAAIALLDANPTYAAGGTVDILELPATT